MWQTHFIIYLAIPKHIERHNEETLYRKQYKDYRY